MERLLYEIDLEESFKTIPFGAGIRQNRHGFTHIRRQLPPDVHELFIIVDGTLFIEADGKEQTAQKGDILFHRGGTLQRGYAPSNDGVSFIWSHFRAKAVPRMLSPENIKAALFSVPRSPAP